jgi:hypothetical protein
LGEKWKRRRRQITPTFHFKILNEFIQVFEEQSNTLVSILKVRKILDQSILQIKIRLG